MRPAVGLVSDACSEISGSRGWRILRSYFMYIWLTVTFGSFVNSNFHFYNYNFTIIEPLILFNSIFWTAKFYTFDSQSRGRGKGGPTCMMGTFFYIKL